MDLREYMIDKLKADGFDGLTSDDCGCGIEDLMPCGDPLPDCQPAYRWECDSCTISHLSLSTACEWIGHGCWRATRQRPPDHDAEVAPANDGDDPLQILREAGIECDEVLEVNILGTPPGPVAQGYKEYTDAAILALARLVVERQTMLYAVLDAVERFTNIEAWMDWSKFYDWLKTTYPDLAARCEARDG